MHLLILSFQIAMFCFYTSSTFVWGSSFILLTEITNSFLLISTVALALETAERTGVILGWSKVASTLSQMIAPTVSGGIQSTGLNYNGPPVLGATMAGIGVVIALFTASDKQVRDDQKEKMS